VKRFCFRSRAKFRPTNLRNCACPCAQIAALPRRGPNKAKMRRADRTGVSRGWNRALFAGILMKKQPELHPDVADVAPTESTLTRYDEQHVVTYARLLQAESEGAYWREVVRIVLHINPDREPDHAWTAYESLLARAKWVTDNPSREHNFLRPIGGHHGGTTWCQNRGFLQPNRSELMRGNPRRLCERDASMPAFDWRSPESYKSLFGEGRRRSYRVIEQA
jgi:hypothetical protein